MAKLTKIDLVNETLKVRGASRYVPSFYRPGMAWDEEAVDFVVNLFDFEPFHLVQFHTQEPDCKGGKKSIVRIVEYHEYIGMVLCIVVNKKFIVNVLQHRFAIREKLMEMPRGESTVPVLEAINNETLQTSVLKILADKLPGLTMLVSQMNGKIESEQKGEFYKDSTFQYNKDVIVLVEIALPDFEGIEKDLEKLLIVKSFWKRPKVWLLQSVLDRTLVYQDALSITTVWYLEHTLEKMFLPK